MKRIPLYSLLAIGAALAASMNAHAIRPERTVEPARPERAPANAAVTAPEIDPSLAIGALTLLGGTLAILRTRRRVKQTEASI